MKIELTEDDARFLCDQLKKHLHEVQVELAHTEKHELQRALAADLTKLETITDKLEGLL